MCTHRPYCLWQYGRTLPVRCKYWIAYQYSVVSTPYAYKYVIGGRVEDDQMPSSNTLPRHPLQMQLGSVHLDCSRATICSIQNSIRQSLRLRNPSEVHQRSIIWRGSHEKKFRGLCGGYGVGVEYVQYRRRTRTIMRLRDAAAKLPPRMHVNDLSIVASHLATKWILHVPRREKCCLCDSASSASNL